MMRRVIGVAAACAGLVVTACGGGDAAPETEANKTEDIAAMQAQLEALPEAQRNGVFMRAIRDARGECQHVESSERAGEQQGMPVWRAFCDSGASFTIVITPGGGAQVLDDARFRLSHEAPPKEGGRGQ
jgi:hypothetical protein